MSPAHRPPRLHLVIAGILVVLFMAQSFTASLRKSPVFDEPPHISSGLSYLETHVFRANLQHPPLLKEMSALFLSLAGIHWPNSPAAQALIKGEQANLEWMIGNDIIHDNGADRVLFWGRLPFILLAGLLGFLIYWWGRELVGSAAALGALFLYAFDPIIIAHSAIVTTDVGLTAFEIIFLFSLWGYIQAPGWKRLVLCGMAMGAVLAAKFSAVFLLPVAGVLLLAAVRWPISETAATAAAEPEKRYAKVGPNAPCPCGSGKKYKKCHGDGSSGRDVGRTLRQRQFFTNATAWAAMFGIAVVVIEILYFFPSDPFLYLTGLKKVNADHVVGYSVFLHGDLGRHFYRYFVEAYLLKEPLATILLSAAGLAIFWRSKPSPFLKLVLLLTPAVMVLATTIFADDMGVRYIIPALPFGYLLGGVALAALFQNAARWGRWVGAAAVVWVLLAAAGIYPDHLSYFNESACLLESPGKLGMNDGTRCGPLWLDDSNVDWGQSLKQLREWIDHNAKGRPLRLGYFGSYPPQNYGIQAQMVGQADLAIPLPGLYAVSGHFLARVPALGAAASTEAGSWLRRMTPVAIVGHAFYIYDVR